MKLKLNYNQLGGVSPAQWLRRAGYTFIVDRQSGQESFARRFNRDFYPRFHLYIQETPGSDTLFFNLHLDQKKASYAGQTLHSADYEGELVEGEIARLSALLGQVSANSSTRPEVPVKAVSAPFRAPESDVLGRLSAPPLSSLPPVPPQPSWWRKLFS